MATLSNTYLDLVDIYRRQDPDGNIADIIEVLMQENDVVRHAPAMECNDGTKHRHAIRTGLPSVAWGKLYKGIAQSKANVQQVEDTTGFVEASSSVDTRLLELAGENGNALRLSEAKPFMEAMNQEIATGIFYHDQKTSPEKFTGLAARYGALGGGGAGNQIVDAGGAGSDNTSIWFVTWGEDTTGLLYPSGTQAGVKHEDKGEQRVLDGDGNPYYTMEDVWRWNIGLYVKDWRYNARIANVDVSDMRAGSVDLYDFMRKAYYKLQKRRPLTGENKGGTVIYCNRDVLEALDAIGTNSGASDNFIRLKPMEIQGQEVLSYRGIPIFETDALINTEARVV